MLKYQINNKGIIPYFKTLRVNDDYETEYLWAVTYNKETCLYANEEDIPESATEKKRVIYFTCKKCKHNLAQDSFILFIRGGLDPVRKKTYVWTEYSFYIDTFEDINLYPTSYSLEYWNLRPDITGEKLTLYFKSNGHPFLWEKNEHSGMTLDKVNIKEILTESYLTEEDILNGYKIRKLCENDYVIYNKNVLYHPTEVYTKPEIYKGKYNLSNKEPLNQNVKLNVKCDIWEEAKEMNFFIPMHQSGTIDNTTLSFFTKLDSGSTEVYNIVKDISENFNTTHFYSEDIRFVKYEKDISGYTVNVEIKDDVLILMPDGNYRISVPFTENISLGVLKEQLFYPKLIEETKQELIPTILDYEKKMFSPVFNKDGKYNNIEEIEFNLHFRERVSEKTESEGYTFVDYGDWKTQDNLQWNQFGFKGEKYDSVEYKFNNWTDSESDLIGYLGFTDDDIYYRKSRLKKSFLRLSFYDSPYRATQTLLYYSTIFINTGELFNKYVQLESRFNTEEKIKDIDFVLNEMENNRDLRLTSRFTVRNKNDRGSSSEGFYLYLFPNNLEEEIEVPLYMKVEFNNAKYGSTVHFTMPVDNNGASIGATDGKFPFNYTYKNKDDGETINFPRLNNDAYIKLYIKYDVENNRYVYYFPNNVSNKLIFNLFESRLTRCMNDGEKITEAYRGKL